MDNIIRYRKRMLSAYDELSVVLPKLIQAVEDQTGLQMISRQELEQVKSGIDKLLELQTKSEQATAAMGASTGHLMEHQDDLETLATLSHYPEIAAQVSPDFVADIHRYVELPVYEQSLGKLDNDRLLKLEAAMNRVINRKRD